MNFRFLSLLSALLVAPCAHAVMLVATFEGLNSASNPGTSYTEGGLQFSSPTSFGVTSGYHSGTLFGGHPHGSTALFVNNTGWVDINASGSLMNSIAFTYGFDWNFYAIENGLMDVTLQWEMLLNGVVTGTGSMVNGRDNRSHGGANVEISGTGDGFDQIRLRSTAVEYQGVYTGGTGPGGWYYDRGNAIGWGDQNHLAFDNVRVQTAHNGASTRAAVSTPVPDRSNTLILVLLAGAGLWAMRRHRRPTTLPTESSETRG